MGLVQRKARSGIVRQDQGREQEAERNRRPVAQVKGMARDARGNMKADRATSAFA